MSKRFLSPSHMEMLQASGLTDETIELAELETERDALVVYRYLSLPPPKRWATTGFGDCLVFPCVEPGSAEPYTRRVRPDRPRVEKRKGEDRVRKYESPKGRGIAVYFPPRARQHNRFQSEATKYWTEGEKKSLLLDQLGYACVGLTGVWNAHDPTVRNPPNKPRRSGAFVLHPCILRNVRIAECNHIIAFDSDAHEKPDVMMAATVLARMLTEAGALSVRLALPPSLPSGEKLGVDDYYMSIERRGGSGAEAIAALFSGAAELDLAYEAREAWKQGLIESEEGTPKKCLANVMHVMSTHSAWGGVLAYDDFRECIVKTAPPPVRAQDGASSVGEWTEADAARTAAWFASEIGFEPHTQQVDQAVAAVAERTRVHPVREYLRALEWDGAERVDSLLASYFSAEDSPYARAIGSRFLISAVARVESPGCQVDCMLVIEGPQGRGKSSGLRALVGDDWFADTGINLGDKDSYQSLRGKWMYELAELDALKGREATKVKNFISSPSDNYRPSYGRRSRDFKRQNVFAGTTNESTYLADPTGNRRFWPVRCGGLINVAGLRADRDQLWAEAFARFERGERWHADTPELRSLLEQAQGEREVEEPWLALVEQWLANPQRAAAGVTTHEVMAGALGLAAKDMARVAETRVGHVLKALGWESQQVREGGSRVRRYRPNRPNLSQPDAVDGWDSAEPGNHAPEPSVTTVTTESFIRYTSTERNDFHSGKSELSESPGWDGTVGTAGGSRASANDWAGYFSANPDELDRLAMLEADAANNGAARRPEGRAATSQAWARWYREHPDALRRDARVPAASGPARSCPVPGGRHD